MRARSGSARAVCGIALGVVLSAAAPPLAEQARDYYQRVVRVQTIARQIMAANLSTCPTKRDDFGFTALSPDPAAPDTLRTAWTQALGLGDGSTVVTVFPGGPAASRLRRGDRIMAVNGVAWAVTGKEHQAFAQAMIGSGDGKPLQLAIRRGAEDISVTLAPQSICAGQAALSTRSAVNAEAVGSVIQIEGGLERLLASDDELAWVIAHEAAHIFLGHTAAERAKERRDGKTRMRMERDADALGLRLMLRAGFAPEASYTAHPKIASASRGPLSRLLDLHGPYMGTRERTEFLIAEVKAARAELDVPAPAEAR